MKSGVLRSGFVVVDEFDDPKPVKGQVMCRTLACGICGSDLHYVHHGEEMQEAIPAPPEFGGPVDFSRDIFMGHEFAAEIVEIGADTESPPVGTIVTSYPALMTADGIRAIAYTNDYPAGYSEYLLLSPEIFLTVPNGLSPQHAALSENIAVGIHAVARSRIVPGEVAIVSGCGPVGLAIIGALKLAGIEDIIAADLVPARRKLASHLGANTVIDPVAEPVIEAWHRMKNPGSPVLFEAVGLPGRLDATMRECPPGGRVVVVGLCMQEDRIAPAVGVIKELEVIFAVAYSMEEFASGLRSISEGLIDVGPLITGTVGIGSIPQAFDDLSRAGEHCKILVVAGSG